MGNNISSSQPSREELHALCGNQCVLLDPSVLVRDYVESCGFPEIEICRLLAAEALLRGGGGGAAVLEILPELKDYILPVEKSVAEHILLRHSKLPDGILVKPEDGNLALIHSYFSTYEGHQIVAVAKVNSTATQAIQASDWTPGWYGRTLLWHGTRPENLPSILQHGLQTQFSMGGKLGTGIYFADEASKAAQYTGNQHEGAILLASVGLGEIYQTTTEQPNSSKAPFTYNSIQGVSSRPKDLVAVPDSPGLYVPEGEKKLVLEEAGKKGLGVLLNNRAGYYHRYQRPEVTDFEFNEYVVYEDYNVKLEYVVLFSG